MRHLWIPSLLMACGDSEEGLKVYNSEPTTTITSHAEGVELQEGVEYTFIGNANDDNHAASTLLVKWSTDARELCPETVPDADGTTSCRIALEASDTQLKLQVTDPEGASAISSINVSVLETGAPDIVFLSPTVEGAYYADQLIQFAAQISDPEDDVYDLSYEWSSSVEGVLPLTEDPDSDGAIEGYMMLTEGQHAISLSVTDTTGKSTSESVVIQVGGPNQEPLCEITEPASSSTFSVGENITFLGTASDEDINNSLLSVQWSSDQDGVINSNAPNTAGEISFVTNSLSAGNHTITLQVEDEIGGLCTDTLLLSLGTPPSISIEEPTNGSIYSVGEAVFFTAIVSDSEDLASDISLSWTSHIDGEFYTQSSDSNGNIYFAYSDLSAGIHNILATATDGSGLTSTASLTLQINTPPPAPTLEITPNPSNTSDVLQVLLTESADADGDAISYTYQWYQNGTTTSYTSETVVSTATAAGDLWKVRVTPNDGFVDGEYAEASVIIANSEPTVDSISLSPTTAYNDSTLTCSATASDADQTLSIDYSWYVGSNLIATGTTLDVSTVSVVPNTIITCEASVVDDAGASASAQASVELENRVPTVSAVQIDTSVLYNDALVSCAGTVSDDDGETASQVVTWSIGGVTVGSTDSIQLDASLLSVGQTLTCTIEASDAYGGTASGSASLTASNRSPVIDSMTLTPASPYRTDTLTCTAAYDDPDTDSTTAEFSWSNSSSGATYTATSATATTSSLDLSTLGVAAGDSIVCDLVVTDTQGDAQSTSQSVEVINSAPVFDVATAISPSSGVYTGTALTCSATASDPNDGSITPTYNWSVNGTSVQSGNSYTLTATDTDVGDTITCIATATDSDSESTTSSASVSVENTEPVLSGTAISPSSGVYNDGTITCSASATDPDESVAITYEWELSSNTVGVGTTLDLSTTSASPEDTVYCTASVEDSNGGSDAVTVSVDVENRLPTTPVVSISPTSPMEGIDDLTCTIDTASTDPDGDPVYYTYSWEQNGGATSQSSNVVSASNTVVGDDWTCLVTPDDGLASGTAGSDSVVIAGDDYVSCSEILSMGQSSGDGVYQIDPDGSGAFDVYCDMTTDGGGWTLILNRIVDSDDSGQADLNSAFASFNNARDSNWWFDIDLFWSNTTEVIFASRENDNCASCAITDYDSAIKVNRPSGSAWSRSCSGGSSSYTSTKIVGYAAGSVETAYMCENALGWGSCSGNVCHYGTHHQDVSSDGAWAQNNSTEMHFPSSYSSYASYGTVGGADGSAWCRSCAGGLAGILNQSSTCCNNASFNAKSRWTIWVR